MTKQEYVVWAGRVSGGVLMGAMLCIAGCSRPAETVTQDTVIVRENAEATATPAVVIKDTKKIVKVPIKQDKTVIVEETNNRTVLEVTPTPASGGVSSGGSSNTSVTINNSRADSGAKATSGSKATSGAKATPRATTASEAGDLSAGGAQVNAPVTVRAEVVQTSTVPDPKTTSDREALAVIKYRVLSVEKGVYDDKELSAAHWAVKDKKLTPAARYKVGDKVRLELEPLSDHQELSTVTQYDDTTASNGILYYAIR
jgi:hypothetical protein